MSKNIQETTATENENNLNAEQTATEQTTNETNVTAWERPLNTFEEWDIAKAGLRAWVDELDAKKLGEVFESKARKTAPFSFQMLAIITHQSAGYIGDKWGKHKENALQTCNKEKTEYNEQTAICEFILNSLAPNLAEARAEKEKARLARVNAWNTFVHSVLSAVESVEDTWSEFDINVSVETFRKMFPKYQQKENGLSIFKTLMYRNLNSEQEQTLMNEHAELENVYAVANDDMDNVPDDFQV